MSSAGTEEGGGVKLKAVLGPLTGACFGAIATVPLTSVMDGANVWLVLLYPLALFALPGLLAGAVGSNFHDANLRVAGVVNVACYAWLGFQLWSRDAQR